MGSEANDAFGGFRDRHAAGMNVGNKIAVSVSLAGFGSIGHVSGKAFGGGQARAFADKQDDQARGEEVSDVVHNTDAAIADDKGLAYGPPARAEFFVKKRKQRRDLGSNRGSRKTVANNHLDVRRLGAFLRQEISGRFAESPS